ncbi:MAG: cytosine/adenosine deaminase-related metal-dependent hydrolase [Paraglaciecola sp.]|jgi:cytosine/adenosine deaminase-related metal-dependent hydrolase
MKKLLLVSVLSLGLLVGGAAHADYYISPQLEKSLVNICEAIRSNSRIKLHVAIKNSGISVKRAMKGLVCNGQDPLTFAQLNGSDKTGKLLAGKVNADYPQRLAKR